MADDVRRFVRRHRDERTMASPPPRPPSAPSGCQWTLAPNQRHSPLARLPGDPPEPSLPGGGGCGGRQTPPKVAVDAPSRRRAHCRWDSGAAAARTRAIAPAPASVMDGLQFDPGGAAIGGVLTTYDPLKKGSIFGASIKKRHTSRFGGDHKRHSDHQINS